MTVPEPTSDQCTTNEIIELPDGRWAVAAWYPSMGGYVSHCLIAKDLNNECVDVYVWHNGEFPFRGANSEQWPDMPAPNPVELHHCSWGEFIRFGELAQRIQDDA